MFFIVYIYIFFFLLRLKTIIIYWLTILYVGCLRRSQTVNSFACLPWAQPCDNSQLAAWWYLVVQYFLIHMPGGWPWLLVRPLLLRVCYP